MEKTCSELKVLTMVAAAVISPSIYALHGNAIVTREVGSHELTLTTTTTIPKRMFITPNDVIFRSLENTYFNISNNAIALPRTKLAHKLMELRRKFLESGEVLLTVDEINESIAEVRGRATQA